MSLSACSGLGKQLDVVGKESITSFSKVLEAVGDKVSACRTCNRDMPGFSKVQKK